MAESRGRPEGPEALRAKLARLRREPPPSALGSAPEPEPLAETPPGPTAVPGTALPTPIPRLPERLRARLARASQSAPGVGVTESGRALAQRTVGTPDGLELRTGPRGAYTVRTTRVAASAAHGAWRFDEASSADPLAFELLTGDPAVGGLDPARALYLDTETTGLEGGAGTYVFLVGLGRFDGGGFTVEQTFLREPADEAAALAAIADEIAAAPAVVTFFGKVFDRHRLEDKMRVHGIEPPFEGRPHLDLCFPFRRLTKGALPDARLQTMERELLHFHRADDLPGSLAPAAWFDFLASRAHRLEGVFQHNLLDVQSLAALAAYLGRALAEVRAAGDPLYGPSAHRALALARAFDERRDRETARTWYERALARHAAQETAHPLPPPALARATSALARLTRPVRSKRSRDAES